MADEQPTTSDKCDHGNEHASCPECNPIFKDEAMTMPGFHYVTVIGDADRQPVVTIEMQDVTTDPRFLGEPPVRDENGNCSHCAKRRLLRLDGVQMMHRLDGVTVTARAFHRFELSPTGGYYADELKAFQS